MTKVSMYKNKDGATLVIWKARRGYFVGEVYFKGYQGVVAQRRMWDMRAAFSNEGDKATEHRICEYFGFDSYKAYWKRWA